MRAHRGHWERGLLFASALETTLRWALAPQGDRHFKIAAPTLRGQGRTNSNPPCGWFFGRMTSSSDDAWMLQIRRFSVLGRSQAASYQGDWGVRGPCVARHGTCMARVILTLGTLSVPAVLLSDPSTCGLRPTPFRARTHELILSALLPPPPSRAARFVNPSSVIRSPPSFTMRGREKFGSPDLKVACEPQLGLSEPRISRRAQGHLETTSTLFRRRFDGSIWVLEIGLRLATARSP